MNRSRNADHAARICEKFVYSIVKKTRLYDYQTWQTHYFEEFTGCAKFSGAFFSDCVFRVLIGCADKHRSRGWQWKVDFFLGGEGGGFLCQVTVGTLKKACVGFFGGVWVGG